MGEQTLIRRIRYTERRGAECANIVTMDITGQDAEKLFLDMK
ncbi:hypothetical protein ACKX2D_05300 [Lachnospiraceae bacterium YH-ros2226]